MKKQILTLVLCGGWMLSPIMGSSVPFSGGGCLLDDETAFPDYYTPQGFSSARARATSRGTVPYWATVCCNTGGCPSDFGHFAF